MKALCFAILCLHAIRHLNFFVLILVTDEPDLIAAGKKRLSKEKSKLSFTGILVIKDLRIEKM